MKLKGKEYQDEMRKIKQDRDDFRTFMKQAYDYNVSEKQQMKKMEVSLNSYFFMINKIHVFCGFSFKKKMEEKLTYENALLEYNRQRLEREKRHRMENKLNLKKDVEQQLELAGEKHKMEQMQRMNNQNEIKYLNEQKALQEIMKEESYKRVDILFYFFL